MVSHSFRLYHLHTSAFHRPPCPEVVNSDYNISGQQNLCVCQKDLQERSLYRLSLFYCSMLQKGFSSQPASTQARTNTNEAPAKGVEFCQKMMVALFYWENNSRCVPVSFATSQSHLVVNGRHRCM